MSSSSSPSKSVTSLQPKLSTSSIAQVDDSAELHSRSQFDDAVEDEEETHLHGRLPFREVKSPISPTRFTTRRVQAPTTDFSPTARDDTWTLVHDEPRSRVVLLTQDDFLRREKEKKKTESQAKKNATRARKNVEKSSYHLAIGDEERGGGGAASATSSSTSPPNIRVNNKSWDLQSRLLNRETSFVLGPDRIRDLSCHDIIFSQDDGQSFPNAGNQFFRRLIRLRQEHFRASKKHVHLQRAIVHFIYDVITSLSPPGRFKAINAHGELIDISAEQAQILITECLSRGVTGMVGWQRPVQATFQGSATMNAGKMKRYARQPKSGIRRKKGKLLTSDDQDDLMTNDDTKMADEPGTVVLARPQVQVRDADGPLASSALPECSSQHFWPPRRNLSATMNHADMFNARQAEENHRLAQLSDYLGRSSPTPPSHYHHPALLSQAQSLHYDFSPNTTGRTDLPSLSTARLGHVPASLLLGTPPTLGHIHHSAAHPHGSADLAMLSSGVLTNQSHQRRYGRLAPIMHDTTGIVDPHFLASGTNIHADDYLFRQVRDTIQGRGK